MMLSARELTECSGAVLVGKCLGAFKFDRGRIDKECDEITLLGWHRQPVQPNDELAARHLIQTELKSHYFRRRRHGGRKCGGEGRGRLGDALGQIADLDGSAVDGGEPVV